MHRCGKRVHKHLTKFDCLKSKQKNCVGVFQLLSLFKDMQYVKKKTIV